MRTVSVVLALTLAIASVVAVVDDVYNWNDLRDSITLSGNSVRFGNDINAANMESITIPADTIDVDGNGHTLNGVSGGSPPTIFLTVAGSVLTIRNLTVSTQRSTVVDAIYGASVSISNCVFDMFDAVSSAPQKFAATDGAVLTFNDCVFDGTMGPTNGPLICAFGTSSVLEITDCQFNSIATTYAPVGSCETGIVHSTGNLTVAATTFTNSQHEMGNIVTSYDEPGYGTNHAPFLTAHDVHFVDTGSGGGGSRGAFAVYGHASISDVTISGSSAMGSEIYIEAIDDGSVNATNITVTNSYYSNDNGGVVFVQSVLGPAVFNMLTVRGCVIDAYAAVGLYLANDEVYLYNSVFENNMATTVPPLTPSATAVYTNSLTTLHLINTHFTNNTGGEEACALFVGDTVHMDNTTSFTINTAGAKAGGLVLQGVGYIPTQTVFCNNTPADAYRGAGTNTYGRSFAHETSVVIGNCPEPAAYTSSSTSSTTSSSTSASATTTTTTTATLTTATNTTANGTSESGSATGGSTGTSTSMSTSMSTTSANATASMTSSAASSGATTSSSAPATTGGGVNSTTTTTTTTTTTSATPTTTTTTTTTTATTSATTTTSPEVTTDGGTGQQQGSKEEDANQAAVSAGIALGATAGLFVLVAIAILVLNQLFKNSRNGDLMWMTLSLFDFATDLAFFYQLYVDRNEETDLFYACGGVIGGGLIVNACFLGFFMSREVRSNSEVKLWFFHNAGGVTWMLFLSVTNLGVLRALDSKLLGLAVFSAPWSAKFAAEARVIGVVSNIFEDIPQLVLQAISLSRGGSNTVTLLSMAATVIVLFESMVSRLIMCCLLPTEEELDSKDVGSKSDPEAGGNSASSDNNNSSDSKSGGGGGGGGGGGEALSLNSYYSEDSALSDTDGGEKRADPVRDPAVGVAAAAGGKRGEGSSSSYESEYYTSSG